MAIPLKTQFYWQAFSRLMGTSIFQRPVGEVRAAAEKRKQLMSLPGLSVAVGKAHPDVLISQKSAATLPIRVYRPARSIDETLPVVVQFHGGGWVAGEPRAADWWCSEIATQRGPSWSPLTTDSLRNTRSRRQSRTATSRPAGSPSTRRIWAQTGSGWR